MRATRLTLALVAGLLTPAYAGTYDTPIMFSYAGELMVCAVSNVGIPAVNIAVTVYDDNGNVVPPVNDACASTYAGALPGGKTCYVSLSSIGGHAARCHVDSSSAKVRSTLTVQDTSAGTFVSVVATKK
jgi:hypothetical protein